MTTSDGFIPLESTAIPANVLPPVASLVDQKVKDFISKLKAINMHSVKDDHVVERLLEESLGLVLPPNDNNADLTSAQLALIGSMQQLLESWISHHFQASTTPPTSRPFRILLSAWVAAAPAQPEAPDRATQVLQWWYQLLAGNLELAPVVRDFNQVLSVYAVTCVHAAPPSWQQQQQHQPQRQVRLSETEISALALAAFEIVREIQAWQYHPNVETHSHLVRCLSCAIRAMVPITRDNWTEAQWQWSMLQRTMTDGLLHPKLLGANQKKSFFRRHQGQPEDDPREWFFLQRALCDALLASRTMTRAHQYMGLDWEDRHPEEQKQQLTATMPQWQVWGRTLQETLLDHPERLEAVLRHAGEQERVASSGGCHPLPPAFRDLCNSCHAWQQMMQIDRKDMDPRAWALTFHSILAKLEALGYGYASDDGQHLEVHTTLLSHYISAMKNWEQSKEERGETIPQQEELLQRLEEMHWRVVERFADSEGRLRIHPPLSISQEEGQKYKQQIRQNLTASFSNLMTAKYMLGMVGHAYDIFEIMRQLTLVPDTKTYGIVLKSLADSKDRKAARLATTILNEMRTAWIEKVPGALQPDKHHYASVLVAWSRSGDKNAARQALSIFNWAGENFLDVQQSNLSDPHSVVPAAMHQLESIHFSALFIALTRHQGREEWWMREVVVAVRRMISTIPQASRNALAVGEAINALKFVATSEAVELAQQLFDELCYEFATTQNEEMKPTAYHFGGIMHTWARAASKRHVIDAPYKIEELLLRLEGEYRATQDPSLFPNASIYKALLNSISVSGAPDAGVEADRVLEMMEEKAKQGLAEPPGELAYNQCIEAHRRAKTSDAGERAEGILRKIAKPRLDAYRGAMQAWAVGNNWNKATHAHRLLQEVEDRYYNKGDLEMKPDYWTYTALLKCCSHTALAAGFEQRQAALRIALQTLIDIEEKATDLASPYIYSSLLLTIQRHTSGPVREEVAAVVFEKCVKKGLVDDKVISELKQVSKDLHRKLPTPLPKKWSENVEKCSERRG